MEKDLPNNKPGKPKIDNWTSNLIIPDDGHHSPGHGNILSLI